MKAKYWILTIGLVLIGAGIGAYFIWFKKPADPFQWKSATVTEGKVKVLVTATGTLAADTTVLVGTQVSGTISKIFVDFNSKVKKGQLICILDTTPLLAAIQDARANVSRTKALLDQAKREYDRNKGLLEQKVIAQADYDISLANFETAQANLESAAAQLNKAKINMNYAIIRAPISGVVVLRNVDVGQTVAASFNTPTLFSIANDLTKMQVQANVDEADIGQIEVGQKVSFVVQSYRDRKFYGTVLQKRLQPTIISNVVNYTVIIDVPNPDQLLLPGMTATITITIHEHDSVLKVPAAALKFQPPVDYYNWAKTANPDSNGTTQKVTKNTMANLSNSSKDVLPIDTIGTVWVIKQNGLLEPRKVIIGLSNGTEAQVNGNISVSDTIAVGIVKSKDGSQAQKSPFTPTMPSGNTRRGN